MVYKLARLIIGTYLRLFARLEVTGLENLPREGPVVIVSNHVSNLDPVVVGCSVPRRVHYMAKEELFRNRLLGALIKQLAAFPVKRGKSDISAIRQSLHFLEQGLVIGMFPEGTRSKSGELQKPHPGVAMIALKGSAPIVPMAIHGSKAFKNIRVFIGKPLYYPEYYNCKLNTETIEKVSRQVMVEIACLLESAA